MAHSAGIIWCAQTDRQTDRHTRVKTVYRPVSLRSLGGYRGLINSELENRPWKQSIPVNPDAQTQRPSTHCPCCEQ